MTLHYTDCFVAFAGDTTHDISRASLRPVARHHRSRRLRAQRRNIISFTDAKAPSLLPSDSSDSDDDLFPFDKSYVPAESSGTSRGLTRAKAHISLLAQSLLPSFQKAWRDSIPHFRKVWVAPRFDVKVQSVEKFNIFWDVQKP